MRSHVAGVLAGAGFWAVIVLSSFRLRAILVPRDLPPVWHDYTDLRFFAVDLALAVLLVAWIAVLLDRHRWPARIPASIAAPGLVLLGLVWVGVPGSLDPALSFAGALELTAFAGLAWFVATEVRTPRDLALPVALMMGLQAVPAIMQVAVQGSVGLHALGEIDLDPATSGIGILASEAGVRLLRAYGLSDHPNVLGGVLALGLIGVTGGLAASAQARPRVRFRRLMIVAAGLGALALAVTFSRAAWIAVLAAALAAAALEGSLGSGSGGRTAGIRAARPWLVLAGVVAVAVGALAIPFAPFLAARLGVAATEPPAEVRSIDERAWLAGAALQVVAAHPLLGTGLGTLPQAMATSPGLSYPPQPAHLVPLTIAAENGIPAALAFCLVIVGALATVIVRVRQASFRPGVAATAIGLLLAATVVGAFDYYLWVFPAGRTWLAIAIGVAVGLTSNHAAETPAPLDAPFDAPLDARFDAPFDAPLGPSVAEGA